MPSLVPTGPWANFQFAIQLAFLALTPSSPKHSLRTWIPLPFTVPQNVLCVLGSLLFPWQVPTHTLRNTSNITLNKMPLWTLTQVLSPPWLCSILSLCCAVTASLHYDLLSCFTSLKVLDHITAFLCHPTPQCKIWIKAKTKSMSLKLSIKRKLRSFYLVPSLYGKLKGGKWKQWHILLYWALKSLQPWN